jgi:hypothetical protein
MAKEVDGPPIIHHEKHPVHDAAHDDSLVKAILFNLGCDRMHRSSGCGYLHDKCRPKTVETLNRALHSAYLAGWEGHANTIGETRTHQQAQQLERALRIFGQHFDTCPTQRRFFKRPCDCGFDKILKTLAARA